MRGSDVMDICTIDSHRNHGMTVLALPAKLLIRSPLAPDCDFELRVERDLTSEEWDILFDYLNVCRRQADRKANERTSHPDQQPASIQTQEEKRWNNLVQRKENEDA